MSDLTHRVVLVGRTNLDGALRLHDGVELLRAHNALEAVGELASMPRDIPGERTFVVVAPEVAINLEAQPALADRFVRAMRATTPGVRVMVQTPIGITRDQGAFDGVLEHDNPLAFLRNGVAPAAPAAAPARVQQPMGQPPAYVPAAPVAPAAAASRPAPPPLPRQEAPRPAPVAPPVAPVAPLPPPAPIRAAPAPVPARAPAASSDPARVAPAAVPVPAPAAPAPVAPAAPVFAGASSKDAGDTSLVAMLIRRADILPAAVALIRERLNDTSVEFVPGSEPAAPGASPVASAVCPVTWDANTFGLLKSVRTRAANLAPHARWLAGWLRLRDQHTQLHEAAFTDALTGAWNRRYFDMFLGRALTEAREQRRFVTVLVFDIDDFKQYNDRFGHGAGDDVLTQTVSLLRSVIRPTDRVCRIGGDEFAVIFDDPQGPRQEGSRHPKSVQDIADRFQRQIGQHRFPALSGMPQGSLSVSGGLATFPWDGNTPAELLKKADDLALAAKREGKRAIYFGTGADGA
ncbi:MAG TPA: GGDEF domain-containing protein [Phycisphaerales bacterium]|nr:GGDEF domain-containing protein [Phycisphaerales bacterium]